MKKLTLIASVSIACLTISQAAKAESGFYIGGGYQLTKLSLEEPIPKGSFTTNKTTEIIDDDLTIIVDNGDGTTTTTTTTKLENVEVKHIGAYLDYKDYFPSKFNNLNIFTGYKFNKSQAIELSFFYQENEKNNNNSNQYLFDGKTTKNTSTLSLISIDGVMTFPLIDDIFNLNIIAGGSMVNLNTETTFYKDGISNSESKNYDGFGINIGLGAEAILSERFSIRTTIKGIMLLESDIIQNLIVASIGLKINI